MPDRAWFVTKIKNSPGIFVGQHRNVAGGLRVQEVEDRPQDRPLHQGFRGRKPQPASASRKSSAEPMTSKLYVLRLTNVHQKSPNEKSSTSRKLYPSFLALISLFTRWHGKDFFSTVFPTTLYRGAGIQTHVCWVAPDWYLWRMLPSLNLKIGVKAVSSQQAKGIDSSG